MGKRQTCPAAFDAFQQTNENHILRPGVFGLVGFGDMIEDVCTAGNLSAGLGIDEIIHATNKRPSVLGFGIISARPVDSTRIGTMRRREQ